MNKNEEKLLRENIRHLIRFVKRKKSLNEQSQLRSIIRSLINFEKTNIREAQTSDNDPTPNKSTGINVLEDLLKKIIPVLETDYKLLTTDPNQRESFRSHVINAVVSTLTPVETNNEAGDDDPGLTELELNVDEEIEINVGDNADDDKFIDIRTDAEKSADDEEEEEDPRDSFGQGVDGDKTGRNVAYNTFKKIESNIIDSYELLSNPDDQELFYDYLIANLKLYFDKFEEELETNVSEPTNQAYDMAKTQSGEETTQGTDDIELDL